MTREEAYNRIDAIIAKNEIDDEYVTITNSMDYDALRMAREILEQEPCDEIKDDLEHKDLCIKGLERDKAMYLEMLKTYEEELRKHMPKEEFTAFATKVAKTSFLAEVMASPNEDFRNTVLENWEDITRE